MQRLRGPSLCLDGRSRDVFQQHLEDKAADGSPLVPCGLAYELRCQKAFSKTLTLQEYEEGEVTCPDCGSKNVVQTLTTFFAVGSKKS